MNHNHTHHIMNLTNAIDRARHSNPDRREVQVGHRSLSHQDREVGRGEDNASLEVSRAGLDRHRVVAGLQHGVEVAGLGGVHSHRGGGGGGGEGGDRDGALRIVGCRGEVELA